ncbi:ZIFL1 [Symbiodinium necroappetens]|uniref:ZIFL1 protein n=1 Tax=Symbiodinium necroappetens TaxID=1628268 RepID=A0A812PHT8_9DINO|nr:ZIFL1 [Symbiodinium necroappetens]
MATKLPRTQVAFACLIDATHFYTVCSLFSYAGILCADLGWVPDRNEAGYLAGWLQSSNVFGRMLTSSIWGYVAARHGFDVVLVVTLTSLLVGGLLFGFCKSLVLAMLVRFMFFGLTHGWVAIMGPYCASVAGDKRQQDVIGMVIAVGTGMQLVGPAVSGWTYALVPSFPALVPSLLGALLALVSISLYSVLHCRATTSSKGAWERSGPSQNEESAVAREEARASKRSLRHAVQRWPIPLVIFMRFCQGFAQFAIFEVAPLWMISDRAVGGLQMSEKQVGVLLARSGLWNIFYFSLVLPRLTTRLGGRCTSIIVSVFGIIFSVWLPFCTTELTANVAHLLATSACLSQAAMMLVFTNNAAGPADRAIVSGLAVTIDTAGKAIAPIATSTLFAWSINAWGLAGHGLVFYILAGLSLVNLLCTALLPASVENQPPVLGAAGAESSEGTIYGASESNESSDSADSDARC